MFIFIHYVYIDTPLLSHYNQSSETLFNTETVRLPQSGSGGSAWLRLSLQRLMEVIEGIVSVAGSIYTLVETVKANKKRCRRVAERVRALEELVRSIQQRAQQVPPEVATALRELCITLDSAQELIRKYTLATWVERILHSSSHGDEFSSVNERLNDAFQVLSGALQVEQGNVLHQVFELTSRQREDDLDRREDDDELKRREEADLATPQYLSHQGYAHSEMLKHF